MIFFKLIINKCPVITFKLKSEIIVEQNIKSQYFTFTRQYHSKGELKTDTIECKVIGLDPPKSKSTATNQSIAQSNQILPETQIKIEGCDSFENACKIKDCLSNFGEVLSEVTENTHYDTDPEAQPVGNGIYQVKMKLHRQIPDLVS